VWRSPVLRLLLAAIPAWFTAALLLFNIPIAIKAVVAIVVAATLWSPAAGLLTVTALVPLGGLITRAVTSGVLRTTEAIVLAFLAAWLLRTSGDRNGPRVSALWSWLLAFVVAWSVAMQLWELARIPEELPHLIDLLVHGYYVFGYRVGILEAAQLLEGIALSIAVVALFRRHPRLSVTIPAALTAAGSVAAASSVVLWRRIGGYRVSGHVTDLNAAGSYFAMLLCLAVGMAVRARGRERIGWCAAAAANGIGLWFSQSRTAVAAAGISIGVAGAWYIVATLRPRVQAAVITATLLVAVGIAAYRVHRVSFGLDYRVQFYETSLRMMQARPVLGVGIGQYYRTSALYMSPQIAWNYGHENAHNNFLQIGAELGVAGLVVFLAWIGAAFGSAFRALAIDRRDSRLTGLVGGVGAFVGTWFASHPLLVYETMYPFWIQFGLMWALAESTILNADAHARTADSLSSRRVRWPHLAAAGATIALVVAATVGPLRKPLEPPATKEVNGLYDWEIADDGQRVRWTQGFASVFAPDGITDVEIPVRLNSHGRMRAVEVDIMTGATYQSRTNVGDDWTTLNVSLAGAQPARFHRIDLRVNRTWQPALYVPGNSDMRVVGVQIGECRFVRNH
jgi:O-antigen ligase